MVDKSKPLHSGRNSPVYEVVQPVPSIAAQNQQTPKEVDIQLNEAYGPLWTLLSLFLTTVYLVIISVCDYNKAELKSHNNIYIWPIAK